MDFLSKITRKKGSPCVFGIATPILSFALIFFSPFHIVNAKIPDIVTILNSLSGTVGTILIFFYGFPEFLYTKKQKSKIPLVYKKPPKNPTNWALFGFGLITGGYLITFIVTLIHLYS
jgi:hypothetical protein